MNHPLKHIPLSKLLIPFALGIVITSYFPTPATFIHYISFAISCVFLVCLALYMRYYTFNKWLQNVFFSGIFFFLFLSGWLISTLNIEQFHETHYTQQLTKNPTSFHVRLVDELQEKKKSFQVTVEVIALIDSNANTTPSSGKLLVYLAKEGAQQLQYADELILNINPSSIEETSNPNAFNYKRYLFHHHIYMQAYVASTNYHKLNNSLSFSIRRWAFSTRKKLLQMLASSGFTADEFAVAGALLLGEKDHLSSQLARAYAGAGAMHVLAVSGLHVGIIFWIVNQLLGLLPKKEWLRYFKASLVILSVWTYALLTGLSPSVIRAATMFSAMAIGGAFRQQTNIYNTLAASAFAILLVEPFMIMQVGMQLSYLAVIGIVYLQPKLAALWNPKTYLFRKAWEITCVSVAAQIATAPLGLLYFHQFPNYFLISNLIVIPAAFLIVFLGVLSFALYPVPIIGQLLSSFLYYTTLGLNKCISILNSLPYAISTGIDLSTFQTWGIYLSIVFLCAYFAYKNNKWITYTMVVLAILVGYQIYERHAHLNQEVLTFYKTRGDWAFSHIDGLSASIAGPKEFIQDKDQMLFHVWHQMWFRGITELDSLKPIYQASDSSYALYTINNKLLLHQQKKVEAMPIFSQLDYFLVSNEQFVPSEWLKKQQPLEVVIDGSWRKYKANKTTVWLQKQHIHVNNLHSTGGIEIQL